MARALMTLLGRPKDKVLEIAFGDLEKATGQKALDAKLIGDILQIAHQTIRDMGLEGDVTAKELYQALRVSEHLMGPELMYVGLMVHGEVVSFSPEDLATDQDESRRFEQRSLKALHAELASEIVRRYLDEGASLALLAPIVTHLREETREKRR